MNIDYDKACSMIKTYFGLKIHKESLMKLLPYCKKIEFQKSEIILEIGEEMKNVYFILSIAMVDIIANMFHQSLRVIVLKKLLSF